MPAPYDWEAAYAALDTPWDKGEAAPPLLDFLARDSIAGDVLVPGCGRGYEVRALAAASAAARVVGLDLAPGAIQANAEFPRHGAESYLVGDFLALPGPLRSAFDWIVEHTCFCAIDPTLRPDYVRGAQAALRPGGRIFAIFYLNPRQYEGEYNDDDKGPPFGVRVEQLDELFGAAFEVEKEWVPEHAFAGREKRELVRILRRRD